STAPSAACPPPSTRGSPARAGCSWRTASVGSRRTRTSCGDPRRWPSSSAPSVGARARGSACGRCSSSTPGSGAWRVRACRGPAAEEEQVSYLAIARKYRPSTFDEIVGQEHVTRTLRNAIAGGRIHHAFLFTGARGVGKTTAARALARALNCEHGPTADPCGACTSCREIGAGSSPDLVEIDGASNNSVDDVRDLRDTVHYAPTRGSYRIYLVDEVHMLSKAAFNALLKTLEEPPPHVV